MVAKRPMPAVYRHCVEVYETMNRDAELDADGALIWVGYTTKMIRKLGLAVPLYSSVTGHLKAMDCIRQKSRGGGGTPSCWVLIQAPTEELWEHSPSPKSKTQSDIFAQQLRDQQALINSLTDRLELVEARLSA